MFPSDILLFTLFVLDHDTSTISLYDSSFQLKPESPDLAYLINEENLTPTKPDIIFHSDDDADKEKLIFGTSSPHSSCGYSASEGSPLSIDSLEEAEAGEEIKDDIATEICVIPLDTVLPLHNVKTTDIDTRPINASSQPLVQKEESPPAKKVCIGDSVPSTTPFLLMQKMLRGETDLKLPCGKYLICINPDRTQIEQNMLYICLVTSHLQCNYQIEKLFYFFCIFYLYSFYF